MASTDIHGASHFSVRMSETEKKAAEDFLKDKNLTSKQLYINTRVLQRIYVLSNQYTVKELVEIFPYLDEVNQFYLILKQSCAKFA